MSSFVKKPGLGRIRTNSVKPSELDEAKSRLGARVYKYNLNRQNGMGHKDALSEAVKP